MADASLRPAALPEVPAGTKFGFVDGKPWVYVEAGLPVPASAVGAFALVDGELVRKSMSVFREDAQLVSEEEFRRLVGKLASGATPESVNRELIDASYEGIKRMRAASHAG